MKIFTDGFFSIDPKHGFLPIKEPLLRLPAPYKVLQSLIDEMPLQKVNGESGLLAQENQFEKAVKQLPNLVAKVRKEVDAFLLAALFRTYSFISSAYTLAPAHHLYLDTGKYGKAHAVLPKNIAQAFVAVAEKLDVFPWLDYHYAYALGNYNKINKTAGLEWTNLAMAAKFSGMDDERGFIMLHVDINQYSPDLVKAVFSIAKEDIATNALTDALTLMADSLNKMNTRRKLMWEASRWKHYNDFRVFIMGIKGNEDIFPDGLLYEGVWDEPKAFRGQTGAQDNIIPTADIASGVIHYYPDNQLTHYLMDLRQYRPKCVQAFFIELAQLMQKNPLVDRLVKAQNFKGMQQLMRVYEEIYAFRNGHWQFVQKYIMQNTAYPKATGGTPITSWIPNQIKAVLKAMHVLAIRLNHDPHWEKKKWEESYQRKVNLLNKQLTLVAVETFDPEAVFKLNKIHGEQDF